MSDHYVLDGDGNPKVESNLFVWSKWFETADREVAADKFFSGRVSVSTAFLGIDYGFGTGYVELFETMAFGGEHEGYQERYATREEALLGHQRAINMVLDSGLRSGSTLAYSTLVKPKPNFDKAHRKISLEDE